MKYFLTKSGAKSLCSASLWRIVGNSTAMVEDSRQLKAEAFAKGRGSLEKDIVAIERCHDDLALHWPMHISAEARI
jgi:alpha-mannosidase